MVTKMNALVYVHHQGQFLHPDSASKIFLQTTTKNFIEIYYDLTYSLPITFYGNKEICKQYDNYFDYCMANVSKKSYVDRYFKLKSHFLGNG